MAVGQPRQHVERGAGDRAGPLGGDAGLGEGLLASRWCSASTSTVVSTPSARMPRSSQRPETPVPVPTSTTARASSTEARKRRAAPAPDPIGHHADLLGPGAGGREHVVLGDELLGVGPARGLDCGGMAASSGRTAHRARDPTACRSAWPHAIGNRRGAGSLPRESPQRSSQVPVRRSGFSQQQSLRSERSEVLRRSRERRSPWHAAPGRRRWDEIVGQHSDARLPAGLPADRQPRTTPRT